jgi:hypothetical protein
LDNVSRLAAPQSRLLLHNLLVCASLSGSLLAPAAEAQLWSDIHVSLADSRSGVVRAVDANYIATVALGALAPAVQIALLSQRWQVGESMQALAALSPLLWLRG